ncbi:ras-interacting protein RIP3-like [Teleopsis dalmanni]|uniref:ras-interacting protein RIP3-like n=1 Tax=Teleopsis dalmanni TaxID=139649 RepID=UPI0018CE6261|nr:ras-interacting protein RIP3-like [Teleopsis dalmanni]
MKLTIYQFIKIFLLLTAFFFLDSLKIAVVRCVDNSDNLIKFNTQIAIKSQHDQYEQYEQQEQQKQQLEQQQQQQQLNASQAIQNLITRATIITRNIANKATTPSSINTTTTQLTTTETTETTTGKITITNTAATPTTATFHSAFITILTNISATENVAVDLTNTKSPQTLKPTQNALLHKTTTSTAKFQAATSLPKTKTKTKIKIKNHNAFEKLNSNSTAELTVASTSTTTRISAIPTPPNAPAAAAAAAISGRQKSTPFELLQEPQRQHHQQRKRRLQQPLQKEPQQYVGVLMPTSILDKMQMQQGFQNFVDFFKVSLKNVHVDFIRDDDLSGFIKLLAQPKYTTVVKTLNADINMYDDLFEGVSSLSELHEEQLSKLRQTSTTQTTTAMPTTNTAAVVGYCHLAEELSRDFNKSVILWPCLKMKVSSSGFATLRRKLFALLFRNEFLF